MESGKFYIVVGATGEGKSTLVKKKFVDPIEDGERLYVYYVNNEYVEGGLPDFETFLDGLAHRRNSMIILEEATIFMGTQNDFQQVREVVIRKRHTGNIIVKVFHTLERIPAAIMPLLSFSMPNPLRELVLSKPNNLSLAYSSW